jgi:cytochrome P450
VFEEESMSVTSREVEIPDFTDPATFAPGVPFAAFDQIRQTPGFYWQPAAYGTANGGFWVVTRFQDILDIESRPEDFLSSHGSAWPGTNLPTDPAINPSAHVLINMDPPRHGVVRRAAAMAFGPRVVKNFDPWVREIVVECLDHIAELDSFDYVVEVSQVIPALVIAQIQGVPRSDRQWIVDRTIETFEAQGSGDLEQVNAAVENTLRYYRETLMPQKRLDPKDDMTTVIMHAVERGDITQGEADMFLILLQGAGFETTHTLISQSMRFLLENPGEAEKTFRAIDELGADRVVDELLRMITPAMFMSRTAARDTEVGGQTIRQGDLLNMYFIAANRDPSAFAEPNEYNPWRTETATLTFGSGPHRCIGNALAKLELRILFEEMAKRDFRLKLDGEPLRGWSVFINQLSSLPVARA